MSPTNPSERWRDQDSYVRLVELEDALESIRDKVQPRHQIALLRAFAVFANAMFEEAIKRALGKRRSGGSGALHGRAKDWMGACQDRDIPVGPPGEGRPDHVVWLSGLTHLRNAILHPNHPSEDQLDCIEQAELPTDLDNLSWDLLEEVEFRYAAIGPSLYWLADGTEVPEG